MQHYFGNISQEGDLLLSKEDEFHLLKVKRGEIGEEIELSLDDGSLCLCRLTSLSPLKAEILDKAPSKRELPINLCLGFGLLKSDHGELIVLKGTELGVKCFYPFISERTVIKPKSEKDNKWARMVSLAKEGAEQSRRDLIPEVKPYSSFSSLLSLPHDHRYLAYEEESLNGKNLLIEAKKIKKGESVLILIGPEGGFSPLEAKKAIDNGFIPISLGKRILRAETAALYASSVIASCLESEED